MMYNINFCRKNLNKNESLYVLHQLESANLYVKYFGGHLHRAGRRDGNVNKESINVKKTEPDKTARPHPVSIPISSHL